MKRWPMLLVLSGTLAGCGNATPPASTSSTESTGTPAAVSPQNSETSASPQTAAIPPMSYEQLLEKADAHLKAKKANEAVRLYSQAIKSQPQRLDAYVKRGAVLAEAKLFTEAMADMTAALKIEPKNAKLLNTRGYFALLAQQYDRASEDFGDAIGLDLNYPQPYNNRGLVHIAQGRHDDAVKDFDNALRAKPDYVDALNNRGFALMQSDRAKDAVASFSKAIELNPKYINALANRGRCYLKLEQPKEAIADFTAAISIQPDVIAHVVNRAEAHRMNGDDASSTADLQLVAWLQKLNDINQRLVRNTRDADAWAERGRHLMLQQSRHADSRRSLDNALAIKPDHPVALSGRAQLQMTEKKFAEAIEDCTKALAVDRRYENYSLRGDAYLAIGELDKAIADYEAARRFDRQVIEAYRKRAEKLRIEGNEQKATADEQLAAALEKQLTDAVVESKSAAPRAMVIEPVKYEEVASEAPAKKK